MVNMEALFKQEKEALLVKLNSAATLAAQEKEVLIEKNKHLKEQLADVESKKEKED